MPPASQSHALAARRRLKASRLALGERTPVQAIGPRLIAEKYARPRVEAAVRIPIEVPGLQSRVSLPLPEQTDVVNPGSFPPSLDWV